MDARTFPMHQAGRRLSTQSGPRACTQLGVDVHPLSKAELGWARNSLFFSRHTHRSSTSRGLGVPALGLMSRRAIIFSPHTPKFAPRECGSRLSTSVVSKTDVCW